MLVSVIFSLNFTGELSVLMFVPFPPWNEPDPNIGILGKNAVLAFPLLSKYCGVGELTALTNT